MIHHIGFNELLDFIFLEKPTPDCVQQAAAINAHLFQCAECRAQYQTILYFRQTMERLQDRSAQSVPDEMRERIAHALQTDPGFATYSEPMERNDGR